MRTVASLADEVKRRAWIAPECWDEDTWRGLFEVLPPRRGRRKSPPEATTRDEISEAVGWYVAAPEIRAALLPFADEDVRTTARELVAWARATSGLGVSEVRVAFPRGPETLLRRWLLRVGMPHDPTMHEEPPAPIEGAQLGPFADRLERFAAVYQGRRGHKPNLALVELWLRLKARITRRCDAKTVLCKWNSREDEFEGALYELLRAIQPRLPREPGSIAELSPKALGAQLLRAEKYAEYTQKKPRKPKKNPRKRPKRR